MAISQGWVSRVLAPIFCNFVSVIIVYVYLVRWYCGKFHILILNCNCKLLLKIHLKEVVNSTL